MDIIRDARGKKTVDTKAKFTKFISKDYISCNQKDTGITKIGPSFDAAIPTLARTCDCNKVNACLGRHAIFT